MDVDAHGIEFGEPATIISHDGNSAYDYIHDSHSSALTTTRSQERSNNFVAGWTAGLGMEYMVWGNVFLRGEWEYVKFMSVEDTNRHA